MQKLLLFTGYIGYTFSYIQFKVKKYKGVKRWKKGWKYEIWFRFTYVIYDWPRKIKRRMKHSIIYEMDLCGIRFLI